RKRKIQCFNRHRRAGASPSSAKRSTRPSDYCGWLQLPGTDLPVHEPTGCAFSGGHSDSSQKECQPTSREDAAWIVSYSFSVRYLFTFRSPPQAYANLGQYISRASKLTLSILARQVRPHGSGTRKRPHTP